MDSMRFGSLERRASTLSPSSSEPWISSPRILITGLAFLAAIVLTLSLTLTLALPDSPSTVRHSGCAPGGMLSHRCNDSSPPGCIANLTCIYADPCDDPDNICTTDPNVTACVSEGEDIACLCPEGAFFVRDCHQATGQCVYETTPSPCEDHPDDNACVLANATAACPGWALLCNCPLDAEFIWNDDCTAGFCNEPI